MTGPVAAAMRHHGASFLAAFLLGCANWTLPVEEAPAVPNIPDQPPAVQPPPVPPPPVPPPPPTLPNPLPAVPGIGIVNANGTGFRHLVTGDWPAWSPDGQRLAFQRGGAVHVISVEGGESRLVAQGAREPSWSPDGTHLAMVTERGIIVMPEDGSEGTLLLRHDFRDDTYAPWDMGIGKPAWSPDGTRIAFEHLGDGDMMPAQVFVMNADGSSPRPVSIIPGTRYAESDPAWSPDGTKIAYWSYGFGIALAPASGGMPWSLYLNFPAVAYGARPAWSPDGSTVMFTANVFTLGQPSLWSVPSGGGAVTPFAVGAAQAVWSPDGTRIALVRVPSNAGGGGGTDSQ